MKYIAILSLFTLFSCAEVVQDTSDRSEEYINTAEQSIQDAHDVMKLGNQYNNDLQKGIENVEK